MHRKIKALLLSALLLALLTGCSRVEAGLEWFKGQFQAKDPEIAQQQEQKKEEEELPREITAVNTEVFTELEGFGLAYQKQFGLNPYTCESLNNRVILSYLYEPLFAVTAQFEPVPVLAERIEVTDEGMTTLVTLRSGVRFHDGTPLTAQAAAQSLEACRDSAFYGSRLKNITAIEAQDERTLRLSVASACENLAVLLDMPIVAENTADQPVPPGTGPYLYADETELLRFSGWWQKTKPLTDYDVISLYDADTAADIRDSFEYGHVNLVLTDPNSAAYASFHNDYELWSAPTTVMQYIGYNINSKVFSNYGLRGAVTYAIDRAAIVAEDLGGFAEAAVLPCPSSAPCYDVRLANQFAYDLSGFQDQLKSASVEDMDGDSILDLYVPSLGYALPVKGTMIVSAANLQRVETAGRIVDALNELGFRMTLEALEDSEFQYRLKTGTFEMYYGEVRLSANFDLTPFFSPSGAACFAGLSDSTMLNFCQRALLNSGNAYDLYKRLCERGYLTPVLFKNYAVYATRGALTSPAQYLDWFLPEQQGTRKE